MAYNKSKAIRNSFNPYLPQLSGKKAAKKVTNALGPNAGSVDRPTNVKPTAPKKRKQAR